MRFDRRMRLNLVLLVVVAALAALAYFRPGHKPPVEGTPLAADPELVQDVRIELAGKEPMELKRGGDAWHMVTPLQFPADAALMQSLLDGFDLPVGDALPAGRALSEFGLDKPLVRITLDGNEYDLGGTQPVSHQRYVLARGQVHLMDDYLFYRVAHDAYWWLDKHLLPPGTRITALQLPHATLTQNAKGLWQLAPADAAVSADAIQKLVQTWQDAQAMGVAAYAPAKELGEVAVAVVGSPEPLRFQLLSDPDYMVLARPDLKLEYQFDISQADGLLKLQEDVPAAASAPARH